MPNFYLGVLDDFGFLWSFGLCFGWGLSLGYFGFSCGLKEEF